jgi:epoxyqueuosine reductase
MISSNLSDIKIKNDLIRYAKSLGFERVGIARAKPLTRDEDFLKDWLEQGRAGTMHYMEESPERRARPEELLPGARSVIAMAFAYGDDALADPSAGEGRVARYTVGDDYHKTITKRLKAFVRYLEALSPEVRCKTFVDTGPLLERAFAQRAGLGFIGKNTMLITKGLGSWVFLASVITTLDLPADGPDTRTCGQCRLCIDACPTDALQKPYELDARLCISYLTIEQDSAIAEPLREKTGPWMFGCDICQEVCPHNAVTGGPSPHLNLKEVLSIKTDDEFRERFGGTAFMRAGREGLLRNASLAAVHLGRKDLLPLLDALSAEPNESVREQAAWSAKRLRPI